MTNEERQLLLTDLCGRLPYGVKCQIDFGEPIPGAYVPEGYDRYMDDKIICVYPETFEFGTNDLDMFSGTEQIKPYLRPMLSMTEEERDEFMRVDCGFNRYVWAHTEKITDWLNAHHFDYRGLIEKGLAIEAPEGMYDFSK